MLSLLRRPSRHATPTTAQKRPHRLLRCGIWLLGAILLVALLHPLAAGSSPSSTGQVGYGGASRSSEATSTTMTLSPSDSGSPWWLPSGWLPSPSGWLQSEFEGVLHAFLSNLAEGFSQAVDNIDSLKLLYRTPPQLTYNSGVVKAAEPVMVSVADGALVLFLVIGGYQYMLGNYRSFRELAPRLIIAAIVAHCSLDLLKQFIDLQDTLGTSVHDILNTAGFGGTFPPTDFDSWATAADYWIIAYLVMILGVLFLSLQMLTRIALLDLCLVLAPLGLLCFALPQTRAWGRLWAQAFVSALIVQIFQMLCLAMGSAMVASFTVLMATGQGSRRGKIDGSAMVASFTVLMGPGQPQGINSVTMLVGMAMVFLAAKLPSMLLTNVLQASKETGNTIVETVATGAQMMALL
jgi:hypothetical protein